MKLISIVTPCFNEEDNIINLYQEVQKEIKPFKKKYTFEHIFIDNCSEDSTVKILRDLSKKNKNVKVILNSRNYGFVRSQHYGLIQGGGDAVILMVADLQDPPSVIPELIKNWEDGYKTVVAVKNKSQENKIIFALRKLYYFIMKKFSETEQIMNFTGFGLYDKVIIDSIKLFKDRYPYLRGIIAEIGFERKEVEFLQPRRTKGKSKFNFFNLYDFAMLGFVSYSKVPMRLAVFFGFFIGFISFLVSIFYLVYKILYWDSFQVGMAPLVSGFFFIGSLQLVFIGLLGEYICSILTQVKERPLVIEKERINFN